MHRFTLDDGRAVLDYPADAISRRPCATRLCRRERGGDRRPAACACASATAAVQGARRLQPVARRPDAYRRRFRRPARWCSVAHEQLAAAVGQRRSRCRSAPHDLHVFDARQRARRIAHGGRARMTRDIIIGIDAGTSVIKSVAFTLDGEQIAVAALPNSYETLADGGVEQDMARTWADTATTLRELGEQGAGPRRPRRSRIAVTGAGRRHLADRRGRASRSRRPGCGSIRAPPRSPRSFVAMPAYAAHYRAHRHRRERLPAERPARLDEAPPAGGAGARGDGVSLQGLALFQAHRRARHRPVGRQLHLRRLSAPAAMRRNPRCLGAGDCERLLPPIVDGTREAACAHAGGGRRRPGLPPARRWCSAMSMSSAPRSAAGCSTRGRGRLLDHRLDRHAYAACAERRRRAAQRERTGYTMAFPAPGMSAQMQSNMAATLNIDWLLDLACEHPGGAGRRARDRKDLLAGWTSGSSTPPGRAALPSLYLARPASAGPFSMPTARAQFIGLRCRHGLCRPDARGVRGPGLRGARLLRGDGAAAGGGAARPAAPRAPRRCAQILAGALGAPVRTRRARGSGRRGCCDDGGRRASASIPTWRRAPRNGSTRCSASATEPDARSLASLSTQLFPIYRRDAQGACGRSGAPCAMRSRRRSNDRVRSPSSATASCCRTCSRRRSARPADGGARHPHARSALARRADGARLCRGGHGRAEGIYGRRRTRSSSSSATPRCW